MPRAPYHLASAVLGLRLRGIATLLRRPPLARAPPHCCLLPPRLPVFAASGCLLLPLPRRVLPRRASHSWIGLVLPLCSPRLWIAAAAARLLRRAARSACLLRIINAVFLTGCQPRVLAARLDITPPGYRCNSCFAVAVAWVRWCSASIDRSPRSLPCLPACVSGTGGHQLTPFLPAAVLPACVLPAVLPLNSFCCGCHHLLRVLQHLPASCHSLPRFKHCLPCAGAAPPVRSPASDLAVPFCCVLPLSLMPLLFSLGASFLGRCLGTSGCLPVLQVHLPLVPFTLRYRWVPRFTRYRAVPACVTRCVLPLPACIPFWVRIGLPGLEHSAVTATCLPAGCAPAACLPEQVPLPHRHCVLPLPLSLPACGGLYGFAWILRNTAVACLPPPLQIRCAISRILAASRRVFVALPAARFASHAPLPFNALRAPARAAPRFCRVYAFCRANSASRVPRHRIATLPFCLPRARSSLRGLPYSTPSPRVAAVTAITRVCRA